jgi:hypothetical protein
MLLLELIGLNHNRALLLTSTDPVTFLITTPGFPGGIGYADRARVIAPVRRPRSIEVVRVATVSQPIDVVNLQRVGVTAHPAVRAVGLEYGHAEIPVPRTVSDLPWGYLTASGAHPARA